MMSSQSIVLWVQKCRTCAGNQDTERFKPCNQYLRMEMLAAAEMGRDTACCADLASRAKSRIAACAEMAWIEPAPLVRKGMDDHQHRKDSVFSRGASENKDSNEDTEAEDIKA
jgi:hypothetical protein